MRTDDIQGRPRTPFPHNRIIGVMCLSDNESSVRLVIEFVKGRISCSAKCVPRLCWCTPRRTRREPQLPGSDHSDCSVGQCCQADPDGRQTVVALYGTWYGTLRINTEDVGLTLGRFSREKQSMLGPCGRRVRTSVGRPMGTTGDISPRLGDGRRRNHCATGCRASLGLSDLSDVHAPGP